MMLAKGGQLFVLFGEAFQGATFEILEMERTYRTNKESSSSKNIMEGFLSIAIVNSARTKFSL